MQQLEKLVCFSLGQQVFALPIDSVQEAVELRPITPVFLVPAFIRGIMNLRGEIVAVLDLLHLLGLEAQQISDHHRVVIVRHGEDRRDQRAAGLLAECLCGVVELEADQIQAPPATLPPSVASYLRGLVSRPDRAIMLLDLQRLFSSDLLAPFRARRT